MQNESWLTVLMRADATVVHVIRVYAIQLVASYIYWMPLKGKGVKLPFNSIIKNGGF